ncbi:MAG TPA: hypothetical protein VM638_07650, partial [Actinomycetota bacterium]|nr:hypothetical protein [Actinomycetota bacterium]
MKPFDRKDWFRVARPATMSHFFRGREASLKRSILLISVLALTILGGAPATGSSSAWCSDTGGVGPCIVSVTRGGATITKTDATWQVEVHDFSDSTTKHFVWQVEKTGATPPSELGYSELGVEWVITLKAPGRPRTASFRGAGGEITRNAVVTSNEITFRGSPVIVTDPPRETEECTHIWPWTCPHRASEEDVMLSGHVSDQGQY